MIFLGPHQVASYLADRFDEAGLPYAFGGALALGAWGVPRATQDVDVSVFVEDHELDRLFDVLVGAGVQLDRAEARRSADRTGWFVARAGAVPIDVYYSFHAFCREMAGRRVRLRARDGAERWFLSAEDVVVTKLLYARDKDAADLARLFAVAGARLDLAVVKRTLALAVAPPDARYDFLDALIRRFVPKPGA